MKKLLIAFFFLPIVCFGQLGDYYNSNNHPKAKGLDFKIKSPLGFDQTEANRPNIVQKWIKDSEDIDSQVTFLVLVVNLPNELQDVSQQEWKQYIKYDGGLKELTQGVENVSNAKYYVLDNFPGVYYEGHSIGERLDVEMTAYQKMVQVFTLKHMFQIQMMTSNSNLLIENESLFNSLANSVIILNQYEN